MGRVFFRGGLPRFAVDLERHPWLATTQRKADPSYPLLGSSDFWRKYEDKPIQLRTQAKWLLNSSGQAPFVEVTLSSLSDPAVIREGHSEGVKAGSR
ncbi:MAG: hypothetical protein KGQ59_01620 [Bdellovibrionales bacterium]|nr:hypothetical protein [Bdellovibrionales bacterium]